MVGKLFVNVSDGRRFLLVSRARLFPPHLDKQDWRLIAVGVEARDEREAAALRAKGFVERLEQPLR